MDSTREPQGGVIALLAVTAGVAAASAGWPPVAEVSVPALSDSVGEAVRGRPGVGTQGAERRELLPRHSAYGQ